MLHWYATGYVEENVLSYRNKLGTESEQTEIVMKRPNPNHGQIIIKRTKSSQAWRSFYLKYNYRQDCAPWTPGQDRKSGQIILIGHHWLTNQSIRKLCGRSECAVQ